MGFLSLKFNNTLLNVVRLYEECPYTQSALKSHLNVNITQK